MGSTINSSNLSKAQGANKPSASWLGRNTWKRILDLALYLVACVTAGTGLLLAYRLPHGAGNGSRAVFFGYGQHEWGDIHTWLAYFGIFLVVVHLALNWQWLVKVAASKHIWRLAVGILSGLIIIAAFLLLPVERAERNRESDAIHLLIEQQLMPVKAKAGDGERPHRQADDLPSLMSDRLGSRWRQGTGP